MAFCAGCGSKLAAGARWCSKCGRGSGPEKTGYLSAPAWGFLCGLAAFLVLILVREVIERRSPDRFTSSNVVSTAPAVVLAAPRPDGHKWFITVLASRNHGFDRGRSEPARPPVRSGEVAGVAVGWYPTRQGCEGVRSDLSGVEVALLGTLAEEGLPVHPGAVRTACISEVDQAWAKWPPDTWVGVLGLQVREAVGHFVCRPLNETVAAKETDPVWGRYTSQSQCNKYMRQLTQGLLSAGHIASQTYSPDLYRCFYCVRGTDPSLGVP
jgi:hypothetical protein